MKFLIGNRLEYKKAQTSYEELALIVVSIIIVSITLFLAYKYLSNSVNSVDNSLMDLNYNFPSMYVNTFLNLNVKDEDKKKLGLNESKIYTIKDLIYINSNESNFIVEKYRTKYILDSNKELNDNKNMHKLFMKFSKKNYEISTSNLLKISTDESNLENLDPLSFYIENCNYYFYFKTSNGKYKIIKFREDMN